MTPYPRVDQLPAVVDTCAWRWEPFNGPYGDEPGFFVGEDEEGNLWLTKMGGSFRAYRELVFERVVQRAGWLCQSSAFAVLERSSLPMRRTRHPERVQLVTRLLPEHGPEDCGPNCPIQPLRGDLSKIEGDLVGILAASPLQDTLNFARQEILAPLFGGFEPAGCLTTIDHEVYLIDGELMFASGPCDIRKTLWWSRRDGSPWLTGQRLTRQICAAIGSFRDDELETFLDRPKKLSIQFGWPIRELLYQARDYGRAFSSQP
jgi:hypothetical protein